MSVEAIRLKNFMAFRDTGWIELRPITLLFGKNSSGKSVIGRALRLLKQSLAAGAGYGPFIYATRQGVDVGSFGTMVHKSGANEEAIPKPITFAFRCQITGFLDELMSVINQQYRREKLPAIPAGKSQGQVEVWLQYEWNDETKQAQLGTFEIVYLPYEEGYPELIVFAAYYHSEEDNWWFHSDVLHGHENDKKPVWADSRVEMVSGFLPSIVIPETTLKDGAASSSDFRFVVALLSEVRETIRRFLQQTDYLGPLRPKPERTFVFDAQRIKDWQSSGLKGYLRYLQGHVDHSVTETINQWLRDFGLCHHVRPELHYTSGDQALVASVYIYESEEESSRRDLIDVGFGLSQVLPVVIQSLVADSGSTLLIEQPELHLHPSAQATLADLLVDCVNRRKARFVLETHSEHMLLRLQRRVAETTYEKFKRLESPKSQGHKLQPEDIEIIFISRMESRSQIENIQVDYRGQLTNPSKDFRDFFKDDYEDAMELISVSSDIAALESSHENSD